MAEHLQCRDPLCEIRGPHALGSMCSEGKAEVARLRGEVAQGLQAHRLYEDRIRDLRTQLATAREEVERTKDWAVHVTAAQAMQLDDLPAALLQRREREQTALTSAREVVAAYAYLMGLDGVEDYAPHEKLQALGNDLAALEER